MFRLGCGVDLLKVGGGEGQFLGQIRGIKLLLRRIEGRRVVGQILVGQIHTHKERVFLHLGLFVVIRRTQLLELMIGRL